MKLKNFLLYFLSILNTFEISFKDLFIENDDKYWFLLVTDTYKTNTWVLGNIFLRKYQFTFNLESKEIGFYNPNLEKKEINNGNKEKDSSKVLLYIFLILALCIIIGFIGYFVKIKLYPSVIKKKRANELDDEFEYVSHKNINNNNNDDNQLFKNDNNF